MWFGLLRLWLEAWKRRAALSCSARRLVSWELFRPVVEGLESRWCPSLTLTHAGMVRGFSISTFATDFPPDFYQLGPSGIAFPQSGSSGVLVSEVDQNSEGDVRLFPTDTDGQSTLDLDVSTVHYSGTQPS